jgi:hypothetical protein
MNKTQKVNEWIHLFNKSFFSIDCRARRGREIIKVISTLKELTSTTQEKTFNV